MSRHGHRLLPCLPRPTGHLATVLILATSLGAVGCVGLRRHSPVSDEVMNARQLSQQGLDAMHRGRYEEAEEKFEQALEQCPSQIHARYQLANCLWKRGAREPAIEQLESAMSLMGSEDVQMMVELGYMHANVGRLDLALHRAEAAVTMAPECPEAWQLYGDVQREVGQWQGALSSYQRAMSYNPDNIEVQLACAEVYAELRRPNRSLATINRLESQIPPQHRPEELLVMKSKALLALERPEEAIAVLADAAQHGTLSHTGLVQLANAQAAAGQVVAAEATVRQALRESSPAARASLRRLMAELAERQTTAKVR